MPLQGARQQAVLVGDRNALRTEPVQVSLIGPYQYFRLGQLADTVFGRNLPGECRRHEKINALVAELFPRAMGMLTVTNQGWSP